MRINVAWLIVTVMIAAIVTATIVYVMYLGIPATSRLSDYSNDVELSLGTQYPGMVDVVSAALEVNRTVLKVTINAEEPFHSLGDGEVAQWNIMVILKNETDVLKTYEIGVTMNSTGLAGSIVDVETQNVQSCEVSHQANSLTVLTVVEELSSAEKVDWRILTFYEQYSGDELITSASDMAPDESLQETVLKP